jgi:hypothetical protein
MKSFYYLIIEEAGFLGCSGMQLGNLFPKFWMNFLSSSSELTVSSWSHNTEEEGCMFLQNVGKQFPNHTAKQPIRPVTSVPKQAGN